MVEPIFSEQAERCLVGAVLLDPEWLDKVGDLPPAAFYQFAQKTMWEELLKMRELGMEIDLLLFLERLKKVRKLEAAGGHEEVARMVEYALASSCAPAYRDIVVEKWLLRIVWQVGAKMQEAAKDERDVKQIVSAIKRKIDLIEKHLSE